MDTNYAIRLVTDTCIILEDLDTGISITNSAERVIKAVNRLVLGGIGKRKVYYKDTMNIIDELKTKDGVFTGFAACTESQQKTLMGLF